MNWHSMAAVVEAANQRMVTHRMNQEAEAVPRRILEAVADRGVGDQVVAVEVEGAKRLAQVRLLK